jgi:hypothetical protein
MHVSRTSGRRGGPTVLRRTLMAAACLGGLVAGYAGPGVATAAYTPIFTSSASVAPNPVAPGAKATITAKLVASAAVSNVAVDVEVHNSANAIVFKQVLAGQNFAKGQTGTFTPAWTTPANQAAGTYTVAVGAFSSDFATGYGWNAAAARFNVGGGSTGFTTSATVSPSSVAPGGSTKITSTFVSSAALSNATADVEVHDASNNKVFQQAFTGVNFSAGQTATFAPTWTVAGNQAAGTYTVYLGVFSANWQTRYVWNTSAGTISIGAAGGSGASYYVDCSAGKDANAGTDTGHAWQSLSRASLASLKPGDSLLLKRGCAWTGPLVAAWSGAAGKAIKIGAYGTGNLPVIQNAKPAQVTVKGSYLTFDQLSVRSDPDSLDSSCKNNRIGYRLGFNFVTGSANNVVQNSLISDLSSGIYIDRGSYNNSIHNTEFAHNNMMANANQFVDDGGATAVVNYGDNNNFGYNTFHDQIACSARYASMGHVFDVEAGNGNIFHHNKAWNNGANFAELGGFDKTLQATNNTFAYNVVLNNGITSHDNTTGTKVYNNTFYFPSGGIVNCEACTPADMSLKNNIFYANTGFTAQGTQASLDESNNVYWNPAGGVYNTQTLSSTSKTVDPLFVSASGGNFQLQSNSPAINAGTMATVSAGLTADFLGKLVPQGGAVDIGAYEMR